MMPMQLVSALYQEKGKNDLFIYLFIYVKRESLNYLVRIARRRVVWEFESEFGWVGLT